MSNDYGAILLNGSSQYGTASDCDDIDFGVSDFTVDVAFTVVGGSGIRVLLSKWVSDVGWRFQIDAGGDLKVLFNGETYTVSAAVDDGEWHYIHMTVDRSASVASIFVDGVLDGVLDITGLGTVSNDADLELGWNGTDSHWNGKVAEVRLSNRIRHTSAFTQDIRQFVDDQWTKALYHFNEGQPKGGTAYDLSTVRGHVTLTGEPTYVASPYEACPVTIVREQVWLALDSYANLTTFLSARNGKKFRLRPGDRIPGNLTAIDTPALMVVPAALPDIEEETSAFHTMPVPVNIEGHLHHKDVSEIEFFWWLALVAVFAMYDSTSTAGRFNFARIQHMQCRGPSFEIQEQEDEGLFSGFSCPLLFDIRHDFLG